MATDLADALGDDVLNRVSSVLMATETSLAALARIGGLDPKHSFKGMDLRGWPFKGQDLRGLDLSDCDLRGTAIERATIDQTTNLAGAILDPRAKRLLQLGGQETRAPQISRSSRPKPPPEGYSKIRLPTLTDAEMLDQAFLISDPLELANIVTNAPPADVWLTYEGRYEVGQNLNCAFGHRHRKGYVFRDETNGRYLVGHNCGQQHFSLGKWNDFTQGRKGLEERASYLRLVRDLHATFENNERWLAEVPKSSTVVEYDFLRGSLRAKCPELVAALRDTIARQEARLHVRVRERDFKREERQRETLERVRAAAAAQPLSTPTAEEPPVPTAAIQPQYKWVDRYVGSFTGKCLLANDKSMSFRLEVLSRLVRAFLARPEVKYEKPALVELSQNARVLVGRLARIQEELEEAAAFFAIENLKNLCLWANDALGELYRFEPLPNGLSITPRDGAGFTILRPPNLRPLEEGRVDEVLDAVKNFHSAVPRP